jgi:hypothetical protein
MKTSFGACKNIVTTMSAEKIDAIKLSSLDWIKIKIKLKNNANNNNKNANKFLYFSINAKWIFNWCQ